ncbi:hypothetical protein [Nodosilinea nodulosa]|uniref:hypothetical protein n=1 Tax=Nodosilinea nodulosa TaxID=416001 RepID=UPI0003123587|nr:hypothetical protein [Nodosilinea nodulosa]
MKIQFLVRHLTDEGRLIEVPEDNPYYTRVRPFPSGFDSEEEAQAEIEKFFATKDKYSWHGLQLVILKTYSQDYST